MQGKDARLLALFVVATLNCQPPPPAKKPPEPPPRADGYRDTPGSGAFFVMDQLALAAPNQGLDLNGDGHIDGAINRAVNPMRSAIDNAIQRDIDGGEYAFAIEIAGIDEGYAGADDAVTIKFYNCEDADTDPTNNFCGQPGCGQVVFPGNDLNEEGQTPYRSHIEAIEDHVLQSRLDGEFVIDSGGIDILLRQMILKVQVPDALQELTNGHLCGITLANDLNYATMPICEWLPLLCANPSVPEELSLAEYLAIIGEAPEIDMDGDGLESYQVDSRGQIARCIDGDGTVFEGANCLARPEIADGFGFCLIFHAVPGELIVRAP